MVVIDGWLGHIYCKSIELDFFRKYLYLPSFGRKGSKVTQNEVFSSFEQINFRLNELISGKISFMT